MMATPGQRLRIFIGGCLIGFAVIIALFIGIKALVHSFATRTTGVVVALRAVASASGVKTSGMKRSYGEVPVISYYVRENGKNITNEDVGFSDGSYAVGDSVDIFYYPWLENEAKLYNFSNYWLNISTVILLVFACIAWAGVYNIINMKNDEEIKIPIQPFRNP